MRKSKLTHRRHKPFKVDFKITSIDFSLLISVLILLIIGVIMVYEASVVDAFSNFNNKYHFAYLQVKWSLIGLGSLFLATFFPLQLIKKLTIPFFAIAVILLVLVLIPGVGVTVGGAQRWLDLGFMNLQPAEIAKLSLILYLSAIFEKSPKIFPFSASLGLLSLLIMIQPDLGTTLVLVVCGFSLYFLSRAPYSHFLGLGGLGTCLILLLIIASPYRRDRLMTFFDPNRDPLGTSYHIRQIIISLGSGGFSGQGLGRSLQKYQFLPEATTDSIFAVIAEETGFIGTILVISLFSFICYKGFKIASRVDDPFLKLLASGLTILIVGQAILNLSAMAALVPLTGITLPFISYGGSSLLISLTAIGLLLNASRYRFASSKINFKRRRHG